MIDDQALRALEAALHEYFSRTLPAYLKLKPNDRFYAVAVSCQPADPSVNLSLGCEEPVDMMKREFRVEVEPELLRWHPDYWAHELIDCDVSTAADEALIGARLESYVKALMDLEGAAYERCYEQFVEAATRALIRVEASIVKTSDRFEDDVACYVVTEDDATVEVAKERYAKVKEGTLEPGWAHLFG